MYGYNYPETDICISEQIELPRGFTRGSIIPNPQYGANLLAVRRNRDGVTVLCPLSPCGDDILPMREMGRQLNDACDEAVAGQAEEG